MPDSHKTMRFRYAFIFAIAAHAVGIFAIGFSQNNHHKSSSIEVTLAQFETSKPDKDSHFFADINQQGSGESEKIKRLSEVQLSALESPRDSQSSPEQQAALDNLEKDIKTEEETKETSKFDLIISNNSNHQSFLNKEPQLKHDVVKEKQPSSLSEQIVALHSQITLRSQLLAKSPVTRTITTMSTKSHQDAAYLDNWRKRIVSVGNIHYPTAANEQKIYGRVRLLIAMQADGKVKSIEILESSGKRILDSSAIKIIHLAAPFAPFSPQMRRDTDILEIIRTIEFEKRTLIY